MVGVAGGGGGWTNKKFGDNFYWKRDTPTTTRRDKNPAMACLINLFGYTNDQENRPGN